MKTKASFNHPLLQSLGCKPRKGTVKSCLVCAKEFYVRPYVLNTAKYCSHGCQRTGQRVGQPLFCKVCGKEYYRPPSLIKWRGSSFCSRKCGGIAKSQKQRGENNPGWKNGISTENHRLRASKVWRDWREAVFERDSWTCRNCGVRSSKGHKVTLHPHHIKPFAEYPELRFDVENGLTLCTKCHDLHTAWQHLGGLRIRNAKKKNGKTKASK